MGSSSCKAPPVAAGFRNDRYNGLWYEVSKAQTAGGAYFEKDCVCTTIDIQPVTSATNGDSTAINSCRKLAPSGDFMNATGRCFKHVWTTILLYTTFSWYTKNPLDVNFSLIFIWRKTNFKKKTRSLHDKLFLKGHYQVRVLLVIGKKDSSQEPQRYVEI